MANQIVTPTWVTNEVAGRFMNSVKGVPNFNRSYDDQYMQAGAKVGATVLARLPERFEVKSGAAWQPQDVQNRTTPITLSYQKHVGFTFSTYSQTVEVEKVRERYVNPAADALASDADALGMADVYQSVYNSVGTPGTTPSTNLTWLQAKSKILDLAGDISDLVAVLDVNAEVSLLNANLSSFNPQQTIGDMFKKGLLGQGNLGIKEWYRDQNVPRHTTGTFTASTPLTNGAGQTGSSLVTDGWASGATSLKKGDIFTIAGVFSVNPLSYVSTGRLQQFVVTADISDTTGDMTIGISPSIITSGAYQTVNAAPADGAAITVWAANPAGGTLATTQSPQSLLFAPDFAVFVMADAVRPEGGAESTFARSRDWNISIRYVRQYSIENDMNGSRMDIIFGAAPLRPELATRVVG